MKKTVLLIIVVIFTALAFIQPEPKLKISCDKSASTIIYAMNHPLHAWTGESKDVTSIIVTDKNRSYISNVAVSVKISSFDSQNANRDSHVIESTEALKYPNITFSSTLIKQEGNKLSITGNLSFHGITRSISFDAQKNIENNKAEITGGFNIKMTQFNIEPPSLMGMKTDDDISINFKMIY